MNLVLVPFAGITLLFISQGVDLQVNTNRRISLVKIWDALYRGARQYVQDNGFTYVANAPELVGVSGACEAADTLFKLDFFGKQAYLAQSDQLYLEMITPHIPKVWAEMQSFRAEPEADDRHLCQFSLFELEFQGDLEDLITHIGGVVDSAVSRVVSTCSEDLKSLGVDLYRFRHPLRFDRITYTEAVDILQQYWPKLQWGDDLKSHHEAKLALLFGPHFITHYPKEIKFFNMRENNLDPRVVNSTDLILPFAGESAGAAERETEYHKIVNRLHTSVMYHRILELGGEPSDFDWYLNAHKDKIIPLHSGTGIGLSRVVQYILGSSDIRECTTFLVNSENLL